MLTSLCGSFTSFLDPYTSIPSSSSSCGPSDAGIAGSGLASSTISRLLAIIEKMLSLLAGLVKSLKSLQPVSNCGKSQNTPCNDVYFHFSPHMIYAAYSKVLLSQHQNLDPMAI